VRHRVLPALLLFILAARPAPPGGQGDVVFPLAPGSVRLAAIGDMGTGDAGQLAVAAEMVRARASFPFEFVITPGDNIYTGSKPSDFEKAFAVPYRPLLEAGVPFYASLGNHDSDRELAYPPLGRPVLPRGVAHGRDGRCRRPPPRAPLTSPAAGAGRAGIH
jgi:hypothetical protein